MTLIQIKNKTALAKGHLFRAALKHIYEPQNETAAEYRMLQDSMVNWAKKLEFDEAIGKLLEDDKYVIQAIALLLKQDEEGEFDNRKALFKQHNIDYRKFHRLPEAFKKEDFVRGKQVEAEYNRENPEESGIVDRIRETEGK